jgi:DNA-binding XRE family transcriptional regulator
MVGLSDSTGAGQRAFGGQDLQPPYRRDPEGRKRLIARKFNELEAGMPAEAITASDAIYTRLKESVALEELRDALRMTQQELAQTLQVDQSAVSKLEHRTDMYVSTLRRCIAAMGGQLEIRAVFPQGSVRINQFERFAADE